MAVRRDLAVWCRGLTKRFGRFTAVAALTFEVERGEVFGFLGPNGAGKSTTIRMLCGLLLPSEGEGEVGGLDIVRQAEEIKSRIGYMSQRFSLYGTLTVQENLEFRGQRAQGWHCPARRGCGERLELATSVPRFTLSTAVVSGWSLRHRKALDPVPTSRAASTRCRAGGSSS